MARTIRNLKLDTRSARSRLPARREPYWTVISAGCAVGYRRGGKGGTWIARMRCGDGKQRYSALGAADDARNPDGLSVFSFSQAQEQARCFFAKEMPAAMGEAPSPEGPYTIGCAIEDYLAERQRRGSKSVRADRYAADARILPALGSIEVQKLTSRRLKEWHQEVSNAPKLVRTKKASERKTRAFDSTNPEAVRSRKATANRLLTILKAALNYAAAEGKVASDEAWRQVRPHREVDAPIVRFLDANECVRLVNACNGAFRSLVQAALVTGARYGELVRMTTIDFRALSGSIHVQYSKSGKARHIQLTDEGCRLFSHLTAGKLGRELIFRRDDGAPWGPSHQQRPIGDASSRAKLDPAATFHILRHTYASTLAMKGVSMRVIADQLGHADTRITERHYAHLAPSYVADVVRAAMPALGIFAETTLMPLPLAQEGRQEAAEYRNSA